MVKGERARVAPDPKDVAPIGPEAGAAPDRADVRLQQLGYKPQMVRGFNAFTNFAISFSIMSLMTGVTGGFNLGILAGGECSSRVQTVRSYIQDTVGGMQVLNLEDQSSRCTVSCGCCSHHLCVVPPAIRLHAQQTPHLQLEAVPMHVRPSHVQASTCDGLCCTACEREPVLQAGLVCACFPSPSLCPLPKSALHTRQLAACITGGRTHVHVAPTYTHVPLPEHSRYHDPGRPWQGIRGCLHMAVHGGPGRISASNWIGVREHLGELGAAQAA